MYYSEYERLPVVQKNLTITLSVMWLLARASNLHQRLQQSERSPTRQDLLQLLNDLQAVHQEMCALVSTLDPPSIDQLLSTSSYDNEASLSVATGNVLLSSALYNASAIYINRILQRVQPATNCVLPRPSVQCSHRIVAAHIVERNSKLNPLRVCTYLLYVRFIANHTIFQPIWGIALMFAALEATEIISLDSG